MIRSLFTLVVGLVITPPLSVIAILGGVFGARDTLFDWLSRTWCRALLRATGVSWRVAGREHLPRDRPVIITCNHQSWLDVAVLAVSIPQRYRFIAKRELRSVPLWGRAWQAAGHIAIDRQDRQSAIRALQQAAELVRADNSAIVIFPEGTRSASEQMLPFRKGAFHLAASLGMEIVPTVVAGGHRILPRGGWRLREGALIVRYGEPIPATGVAEHDVDELMARVRSAMECLLRAPADTRAEGHAGDHEHTRA